MTPNRSKNFNYYQLMKNAITILIVLFTISIVVTVNEYISNRLAYKYGTIEYILNCELESNGREALIKEYKEGLDVKKRFIIIALILEIIGLLSLIVIYIRDFVEEDSDAKS